VVQFVFHRLYTHLTRSGCNILMFNIVQRKIYTFFFNSKEIGLKSMSVERMNNYLELPKTASEKMLNVVAEN
jgi:hypothetical protein